MSAPVATPTPCPEINDLLCVSEGHAPLSPHTIAHLLDCPQCQLELETFDAFMVEYAGPFMGVDRSPRLPMGSRHQYQAWLSRYGTETEKADWGRVLLNTQGLIKKWAWGRRLLRRSSWRAKVVWMRDLAHHGTFMDKVVWEAELQQRGSRAERALWLRELHRCWRWESAVPCLQFTALVFGSWCRWRRCRHGAAEALASLDRSSDPPRMSLA